MATRRRLSRLLFFGVISLTLSADTQDLVAQIVLPRDTGIALGRVNLYPSIAFELTHDDNVFLRSEEITSGDIIESGALLVRPRVLVDIPIGEHRITWAYSALFRDYDSEDFSQSERLSHFLDLDGSFQVGRLLTVAVRDRFVRTAVELQEFDPGGELTFGLVPFVHNDAEMALQLRLGPRQGLSFLPRHATGDFDEEGTETLFGYETKGLEARYNYALSIPTTAYAYYQSEDTDQEREQLILGERGFTSRSVGIGIRRSLNEAVVAEASAGYESISVAGTSDRDFSGAVFNGLANWRVSDVTHLQVSARRMAFQSFFVNNNYYISERFRLGLMQQLGARMFWQAAFIYQINDYPEAINTALAQEGFYDVFEPSDGLKRRDKDTRFEVGIGYQIRNSLRAFIGYTGLRRNSNVDGYCSTDPENACYLEIVDYLDYSANRLAFRLEVGWL